MDQTYRDFMTNTRVEIDKESAHKVQEMSNYYNSIVDEVRRIENLLASLKVQEKEFTDFVEKNKQEQEKLDALLVKQKQISLDTEIACGQLNDYNARLEALKKELQDYKDLSVEITQLKSEKADIELFNQTNAIDKNEIAYLKDQRTMLQATCLDLETKRTNLKKDIIEKENQNRLLERDLELPEKKLKEAKELNDAAQSTFAAIEKMRAEDAKNVGTIGWYITKLKKKYPNLEFMNLD